MMIGPRMEDIEIWEIKNGEIPVKNKAMSQCLVFLEKSVPKKKKKKESHQMCEAHMIRQVFMIGVLKILYFNVHFSLTCVLSIINGFFIII